MTLFFTTETCSACHRIKEYLKEEMDVIYTEIVLSDETRSLFQENKVKSAPTILFLKDEVLVHRQEGFLTKAKFLAWYEKTS